MASDPVADVFAPFKPAVPLAQAPTTDSETTNAPKGKRGRKAATEKKPRAPKATAADAPVPEKSAVQQTVIMVDAVTFLTALQNLDDESKSVFLQGLGALQALKPAQRSQIAHALAQLFP